MSGLGKYRDIHPRLVVANWAWLSDMFANDELTVKVPVRSVNMDNPLLARATTYTTSTYPGMAGKMRERVEPGSPGAASQDNQKYKIAITYDNLGGLTPKAFIDSLRTPDVNLILFSEPVDLLDATDDVESESVVLILTKGEAGD